MPAPVSALPSVSDLPGVNILLIGPSGSGKTTAIKTLIDSGITPFCVFTEPGFEVLGDIPKDKLHWHYVPPATTAWAAMIGMAEKVNQLSLKSLSEMVDSDKSKYNQFVSFLKVFNNFTCQRDGKSYGDVCNWNTDRALVVDTLTGINTMAMGAVVGGKPVRNQSDWGIAQNLVEFWFQKLCSDTRCHFIVMAHAEREVDMVSGQTKIMASTLGKALAPKLPRLFSDVILSVKEAATFTWSTAAIGADLKARNLEIKDGLPPSFGPIIKSWQSRGGTIQETKNG